MKVKMKFLQKRFFVCLLLTVLAVLFSACGKTAAEMHEAPSKASAAASDAEASSETPSAEPVSEAPDEPENPVILVDRGNDKEYFEQNDYFLKYYALVYGEEPEYEFVTFPTASAARESEVQHYRVEIVAGGGPDAFILNTADPQLTRSDPPTEVLFPDVVKAMQNQTFLPLDDLLASSEFYRPEEHVAPVMEAGKLDGETLVLPLLYSMNLYVLDRDKTALDPASFSTWEDLSASEDPDVANLLGWNVSSWFDGTFSTLADYGALNLTLEKDALTEALRSVKALHENGTYEAGTALLAAEGFGTKLQTLPALRGADPEAIFPVLNDAGGITAQITAFCAINRSTAYAEECLKLLSLLYAEEIQSNYGRSVDGKYVGASVSPTNAYFGAVRGVATGYASPFGEALRPLTERINSARFYSTLDAALYDAADRVTFDGQTPEDAAENAFEEMRMILAE